MHACGREKIYIRESWFVLCCALSAIVKTPRIKSYSMLRLVTIHHQANGPRAHADITNATDAPIVPACLHEKTSLIVTAKDLSPC